jgi:alpha-glucosidase
VREHPAGSVLVCARRAAGPALDLPADEIGFADGAPLLAIGGEGVTLAESGRTVSLPAGGPGVWVWAV